MALIRVNTGDGTRRRRIKKFCVRSVIFGLLFLALMEGSHAQSCRSSSDLSSRQVQANQSSFVDWARDHAINLQTVEAGHGFRDMEPLKKLVGNARIVALGEATHGTHEFFQLKHRMLEFLASQMGFTIFSIEANMPEAYKLNDFVVNGKGDPTQLLKGMYFWTWDTEEVLQMILWMRQFNRSGKGHIEFTGFDMQTPSIAMETVRQYVEKYDSTYLGAVDRAYKDVTRLSSTAGKRTSSFGVATGSFPVQAAAGKHVRYSGFVRTENITKGYAGLWWRVDGKAGSPPLQFDNMQDRGAKGTTPWTHYEIAVDVPPNASNINFGVIHTGNGTAWFDALRVEIDDVVYTDTGRFDLDFESTSPRGFYVGGNGYEVSIDGTVAYSGKQSLRSRFVGPPTDSSDEDPIHSAKLAEDCKQILRHLEASRATLPKASKTDDLEWATQNARLVVQYMELKTGERSRDESMADNVQWIANRSPDARIVIWAHNGHIAYQWPEYRPMGEYLRRMFGVGFMNFGFVFNEGSFRAAKGGGGIQEFKVESAPEGSIECALAAVRIPVMALDFRLLPRDGPAWQWVDDIHALRSIGSVYNPSNAMVYFVNARPPDLFDVVLFVDHTTASHGND